MHALNPVPPRHKNSLPVHIQGKADYNDYGVHTRSNSYSRKIGEYELDLEFINRTWYIITWNKGKDQYFVNPATDILQNPHYHGLRTLDQPAEGDSPVLPI